MKLFVNLMSTHTAHPSLSSVGILHFFIKV
jgi:hypothetical protein